MLVNPSRVCVCCRPAITPRAAIPQATCDAVRSVYPDVERAITATENWRGPHEGIEKHLIAHGKTVALKVVSNTNGCFDLIESYQHMWFISDIILLAFNTNGIRRASMILRAFRMRETRSISLNNYHRRLGICLGYTDEQINNFITSIGG